MFMWMIYNLQICLFIHNINYTYVCKLFLIKKINGKNWVNLSYGKPKDKEMKNGREKEDKVRGSIHEFHWQTKVKTEKWKIGNKMKEMTG